MVFSETGPPGSDGISMPWLMATSRLFASMTKPSIPVKDAPAAEACKEVNLRDGSAHVSHDGEAEGHVGQVQPNLVCSAIV